MFMAQWKRRLALLFHWTTEQTPMVAKPKDGVFSWYWFQV
jgi:hypothetical protein